jgi:hypothetical protein
LPLVDQTFLDLSDRDKAERALRSAAITWLARGLELSEDGQRLPMPTVVKVRASLESEKTFDSFEHALAHVEGPGLARDTRVPWNQVMLDAVLEAPIASERGEFSIRHTGASGGNGAALDHTARSSSCIRAGK